jgi:hypothetical protein
MYGEEMTREQQLKIAEMNRKAQLEAANIAAGKKTNEREYVADYLQAARDRGDKRSDATIREEGARTLLIAQKQAALEQAGVAQQGANIRARAEAEEVVNKRIQPGGRNYEDYARLKNADRQANRASGAQPGDPNYQDTAGAYEEKLFQEALGGRPLATGSTPPATPAGGAGTRSSPLPMPTSQAQMVKGKVYRTAQGLAEWDGSKFISVQ